MDIQEVPITTIDGQQTTLENYSGKAILIVNVASKCGFTPQYAALQYLFEKYEKRGFVVLGFPCNQFLRQEPGNAAEIKEFCTSTYQVTFPMFEKVKVNGKSAHPLFVELAKAADSSGTAGRVKWNFEKFLISPSGSVQRFRSAVVPDAPEIVQAIESALPS